MKTCSRIRWAAGLLAAWLLSGCAGEARPPVGTPTSGPQGGQGNVPFDVQKVIEQVHFAFRPQGTTWEGGHGTYGVRVGANGFSVTPFHHPEGQPEGAGAAQPSPEQQVRPVESSTPEYVKGEPVRFGVSLVTRGNRVLASQAGHGQVEDTGGLTLARGEVAEHFRNSEDGVEQSWSFARRPEGAGALEVRVPVENGRFLGETAKGLHFAAGPTDLGVRYGHGIWVDAEGHRTPVPARFEAGAIVLRVAAQVVEDSAYPAVLDPTVSPELGMDTPVSRSAEKNQTNATVASDGTNFLVVWEDSRSDGSDIYGARVSGAGQVLDKSGIAISLSTAINSQSSPVVAHNGTHFLVVWQAYRQDNFNIYGARIDGNGTVLDPNGIAISTAAVNEFSPAVSSNGTKFLVVWESSNGDTSDIYGARVASSGQVFDPNGIAISTAANNQSSPRVAHNGTNFLIVWMDSRSGVGSFDIYGARVDSTGSVLDSGGFVIYKDPDPNLNYKQSSPAVASNGTDFLVVWEDHRNGNADIYGARVSGSGSVLDSSGISIINTEPWQNEPAVASDGANFLVVWAGYYYGPSNPNIYGAWVSGSGSVSTPVIAISEASGRQTSPTMARNGTNFLVVWEDSSGTNSDIYGARLNGSGEVLGSSLISQSANGQYTPVVTHDGVNFLVVWVDHRSNTGNDIYGARVNSSGLVLDTTGIAISTAIGNQTSPTVAFDGTNYLVVWVDYRNGNADIYKTRVTKAGEVLAATGSPVSTATGNQTAPAVAFDGTNYLVVWVDYRNDNADIYKTRVTKAGEVLAPDGTIVSTEAGHQTAPAVAFDGTNFLVVWVDSGDNNPDIYGTRVNSSGLVLDSTGIAISTAVGHQTAPAVAFDGTNFLVVWADARDGFGFSDIYGARVSGTGSVLDSTGHAISDGLMAEREPMLTSMGGGQSLVVYRSTQYSATLNSERVMARMVEFP